jgi:hypothetical protein
MLQATKTQMKTNLKLYLEYLECYDQSLYIDHCIEFQPLVGIIGDLLHHRQEEILGEIFDEKCQMAEGDAATCQ